MLVIQNLLLDRLIFMYIHSHIYVHKCAHRNTYFSKYKILRSFAESLSFSPWEIIMSLQKQEPLVWIYQRIERIIIYIYVYISRTYTHIQIQQNIISYHKTISACFFLVHTRMRNKNMQIFHSKVWIIHFGHFLP